MLGRTEASESWWSRALSPRYFTCECAHERLFGNSEQRDSMLAAQWYPSIDHPRFPFFLFFVLIWYYFVFVSHILTSPCQVKNLLSRKKKLTCANFEATSPRPECLWSWFVNGVSPLTFINFIYVSVMCGVCDFLVEIWVVFGCVDWKSEKAFSKKSCQNPRSKISDCQPEAWWKPQPLPRETLWPRSSSCTVESWTRRAAS